MKHEYGSILLSLERKHYVDEVGQEDDNTSAQPGSQENRHIFFISYNVGTVNKKNCTILNIKIHLDTKAEQDIRTIVEYLSEVLDMQYDGQLYAQHDDPMASYGY